MKFLAIIFSDGGFKSNFQPIFFDAGNSFLKIFGDILTAGTHF